MNANEHEWGPPEDERGRRMLPRAVRRLKDGGSLKGCPTSGRALPCEADMDRADSRSRSGTPSGQTAAA